MINILIPLGGKSSFFDSHEFPYPKPLIEIHNKTMIQLVIENFSGLTGKKFIFVVNKADCDTHHLDDILSLLTDNQCEIVKLSGETKGAACSALMAIEHIDSQMQLIITNGDQVIDIDVPQVVQDFKGRLLDAGVITFESVHPKWSYIRADERGHITESAEKRPLSKNAIAGFYYFKHGSDFVKAATQSIAKDANVNGMYYIAPTLNEIVLANKVLGYHKIPAEKYHSFYSPQKIKEYEKELEKC